MKKYTRINKENRFEIYELKHSGLGVRKMAATIGKHLSTISRELRRNVGQRGYRSDQAKAKADARKKMSDTVHQSSLKLRLARPLNFNVRLIVN